MHPKGKSVTKKIFCILKVGDEGGLIFGRGAFRKRTIRRLKFLVVKGGVDLGITVIIFFWWDPPFRSRGVPKLTSLRVYISGSKSRRSTI